MSYYEYEPNREYYYYDEYTQYPESDLSYDDPGYFDYRAPKRYYESRATSFVSNRSYTSSRNSLTNGYHLVSQESVPGDVHYRMPHYVVPVVYAPTRIVSMASNKLKGVGGNNAVLENIDKYYSEKKNFDVEADYFQKMVRRCPRRTTTIREESEESTVCFEREKSDSDSDTGKEVDSCTTDGSQSTAAAKNIAMQSKIVENGKSDFKPLDSRAKRFCKKSALENLPGGIIRDIVPEEDEINSWSTTNSKGKKSSGKNASSDNYQSDETKYLTIQSSSERANSATISSTTNGQVKNCKQQTSDLHSKDKHVKKSPLEKNALAVSNDRRSASTDCINSIKDVNMNTSEIISWKNKSMQDSSVSTSNEFNMTSKSSILTNSKMSNLKADSSDYTDITVTSDEYRQFLASINKRASEIVTSPNKNRLSKNALRPNDPDNNQKSLDFKYEINDSPVSISVSPTGISTTLTKVGPVKEKDATIRPETAAEIEVKTTVSVNKNSMGDCRGDGVENVPNFSRPRSGKADRAKVKKNASKMNPLTDAPLDISSKNLFRKNYGSEVLEELPLVPHSSDIIKDCKDQVVPKRSLFIKVFRFVVDVISFVQNYSYRYVFRYILFI